MKRKKPQLKVGMDKSETVAALPLACCDEAAAVAFMEAKRWGDKPVCAHCQSEKVYKMTDRKTGERNKRFLWKCNACSRQYTVRIGTVFEDSRIPARHWCHAFWRACSSKKGVSALQIKREIGVSYKSALFMMHRIRFAMTDEAPEKLRGTIEADETYCGGKPRFKDSSKRGRGACNKIPVVAMVQRDGNAHAMPVERLDGKTLKQVVLDNVDTRSRLITDEWRSYLKVGKEFKRGHHRVNHGRGEYVRGNIHTNTVEGFFALLKRGLYGTFHAVSRRHLHRYVNEFSYRWNTRHLDDGERTAIAIQGAVGGKMVYN